VVVRNCRGWQGKLFKALLHDCLEKGERKPTGLCQSDCANPTKKDRGFQSRSTNLATLSREGGPSAPKKVLGTRLRLCSSCESSSEDLVPRAILQEGRKTTEGTSVHTHSVAWHRKPELDHSSVKDLGEGRARRVTSGFPNTATLHGSCQGGLPTPPPFPGGGGKTGHPVQLKWGQPGWFIFPC